MNEMYLSRLRCLFRFFIEHDYNVLEIHNALFYICSVMQHRRDWRDAETSEGEALASRCRDDARQRLVDFLHFHCAPDDVRNAAVWLSEHTP